MMTTRENRKMTTGIVFLSGAIFGIVTYLVAESLIPRAVANAGDHDLLLANRLGYIYTAVVGVWLGWLQRSWQRALLGVIAGVVIGIVYMWLSASRDFIAIMIAFPCLLGGGLAGFVGSNRSHWLKGFGVRLGKGLLAGFVLGIVYMITLNIVMGLAMAVQIQSGTFTERNISMMWRAGPVALGLSSALFFILIRWAVGLTRVKLIVFEEAEATSRTGSSERAANT